MESSIRPYTVRIKNPITDGKQNYGVYPQLVNSIRRECTLSVPCYCTLDKLRSADIDLLNSAMKLNIPTGKNIVFTCLHEKSKYGILSLSFQFSNIAINTIELEEYLESLVPSEPKEDETLFAKNIDEIAVYLAVCDDQNDAVTADSEITWITAHSHVKMFLINKRTQEVHTVPHEDFVHIVPFDSLIAPFEIGECMYLIAPVIKSIGYEHPKCKPCPTLGFRAVPRQEVKIDPESKKPFEGNINAINKDIETDRFGNPILHELVIYGNGKHDPEEVYETAINNLIEKVNVFKVRFMEAIQKGGSDDFKIIDLSDEKTIDLEIFANTTDHLNLGDSTVPELLTKYIKHELLIQISEMKNPVQEYRNCVGSADIVHPLKKSYIMKFRFSKTVFSDFETVLDKVVEKVSKTLELIRDD